MIPTAEVELRQGKTTKKATARLDTGMNGTYVMVPKTMADELGIVATGKEIQNTIDGPKEVLVGKLDLVRLVGLETCSLANGKVTIGGDQVWLGQPFLAATGAAILYLEGRPALMCSGNASSAVGVFPQFSFDIIHKNRRQTVTGIVDTGFYGGLGLPPDIAGLLGLQANSKVEVQTPSGKKEVGVTTVDRLIFSGHPKCGVDNVETVLLPADAPFKAVIVGEKFLSTMPGNSAIEYVKNGVIAVCGADESVIQAAKTVYLAIVRPEDLPSDVQPALIVTDQGSPSWIPWAIAGVAAAGIAGWLIFKR